MLQTQDEQGWGQGHEQRGHIMKGQGQSMGAVWSRRSRPSCETTGDASNSETKGVGSRS